MSSDSEDTGLIFKATQRLSESTTKLTYLGTWPASQLQLQEWFTLFEWGHRGPSALASVFAHRMFRDRSPDWPLLFPTLWGNWLGLVVMVTQDAENLAQREGRFSLLFFPGRGGVRWVAPRAGSKIKNRQISRCSGLKSLPCHRQAVWSQQVA